jgi:CO dehydrogenase maturation factor
MAGRLAAMSGKGGSGKTTLAALVLRRLLHLGVRPILAVDADPNATLGLALGAPVEDTIADLRDRLGEAALEPSAVPKERLLDKWLAELLVEAPGFDLLTMGRPEGPKCYCYVNGLLRRYLKELRGNYAALVVDCEAGMEYLSRLTVDDIDTLVLVAEETAVGLASARRIGHLAERLPIRVRRRVLVRNKTGLAEAAVSDHPSAVSLARADAVIRVPFDAGLYRRCAAGEPIDAAFAAESAAPATRAAVAALADLCRGKE